MLNFATKLNNLNYFVMFVVSFKILKDYSCEEFISSLKTLIRFDMNKEFEISVAYSKEFTSITIEVSNLCVYDACDDIISYARKIMQEKNIKGFPTKVYFAV